MIENVVEDYLFNNQGQKFIIKKNTKKTQY